MPKTLTEIAADILRAQAKVARMAADELSDMLRRTYESLRGLRDKEKGLILETPRITEPVAAMGIKPESSIQRNTITCLECKKTFKILSKNHLKVHGLTPKEYRKKYGFKAKQALAAKSLSADRRKIAKKLGLGQKLAAGRKKKNQ
jgi:predicted transcriptional regulator